MLLQIEISIIIIAIIINLYFSFTNIINRYRFTVNRLFALISFLGAILSSSFLYIILFPDSENLSIAGKSSLGTLLLVCILVFCLSEIYPRWEKKTSDWFIILSLIPGIVVCLLTVFTDLIIVEIGYDESLRYTLGILFPILPATFGVYFIGSYSILLYKYKYLENESFKYQLFHFLMGINVGALCFLILTVIFPLFLNVTIFRNIGISLSSILLLIVSNYAVSDDRLLDFKQFYLKLVYWLILLVIILFPIYSGLEYYNWLIISKYSIPPLGIAILLSLFPFLLFRYISPQVEKLLQKRYKSLERAFNESLEEITNITNPNDKREDWDTILKNTINSIQTKLKIADASLYLYNVEEYKFSLSYGFGDAIKIYEINEDSDLALCLKEHKILIEKSMLFTDETLSKYKESLLNIFNEKSIQIALPLFNHEKTLIAILLLGRLQNRKPYLTDFLSLLETYRIQLSISLANSIIQNEMKVTQIIKHDKTVVTTIKKKIIPKRLKQIDGIRISSFFLDNSEYGGDYFDSVRIAADKLGIFMTNTSDTGVDSGILALEIYSVLQTQMTKYSSPERLLNNINRVVSSSRFSDKYAQASYLVYSSSSNELKFSNAAYNPLILLDVDEMNFQELDVDGIPLGIDLNFSYRSKNFRVRPNTIGVSYSNGILAAINKNGENYSIERLKKIITNNINDTPTMLIRNIYSDFSNFVKGTELLNDASLIIFRIG
ncbi:MAG: SpoIIE family protein phosphatase [Spirochaetota bacterium]|nr:SpoIIE family protein phosphatase [Spirochaetota bacterium]